MPRPTFKGQHPAAITFEYTANTHTNRSENFSRSQIRVPGNCNYTMNSDTVRISQHGTSRFRRQPASGREGIKRESQRQSTPVWTVMYSGHADHPAIFANDEHANPMPGTECDILRHFGFSLHPITDTAEHQTKRTGIRFQGGDFIQIPP
jgi:hypothetical protein